MHNFTCQKSVVNYELWGKGASIILNYDHHNHRSIRLTELLYDHVKLCIMNLRKFQNPSVE